MSKINDTLFESRIIPTKSKFHERLIIHLINLPTYLHDSLFNSVKLEKLIFIKLLQFLTSIEAKQGEFVQSREIKKKLDNQ